ncbi:hypothetical protein CAEBREN_12759 [Caenorhabditis brenneri]|uniref:Uncharacterized protein n=1 Tax=Caenorhabditis brenneri TaxID=135651 RepID=G0NS77_CAEBE|nr:hypothetical protein CAEBREN_12759 [Caenorhabditis brenneri]
MTLTKRVTISSIMKILSQKLQDLKKEIGRKRSKEYAINKGTTAKEAENELGVSLNSTPITCYQ